ncbi:MAG: VanZ family protein [Candidatus Pacearchaeota archaeon]|jgi:VanZ family protein
MIKILEKNKTLSIIFLISIITEIFYFSSLSFSDKPKVTTINIIPTTYHFIVFFLLAFFILTTIKGNKKIKLKYTIITFIFSIIYAILDEAHQIFISNRFASFNDIITDSLGIFFSILIYTFIDYKTKQENLFSMKP